jgi:hypothetical protein
MKELTEKQAKFIVKWKELRKKKFLYILKNIYWGIPLGIIIYFSLNHFKLGSFDLERFLITFTFVVISVLYYGQKQFNILEKAYLKTVDNEDILSGISILEAGKVWNYENLIIKKEDIETLIVKNKLFWLDDSNPLSENLDECLNIVMKDFERLKTNSDFDVFSSEFKIKIQVYNNSDKVKPLIEMSI